MRPLQKLIYNSVDSQTQIDNIANISWENGRYNFKDVPLAQLIQIVSQMYHTDILLQGVRKENPHSAAAFIIMSLWTRY